jgi:hypothetical protein
MDNDHAKLILQAYRPGGEDTSDPFFSEALEQARLDPSLGRWFAEQQAFDSRMRQVLESIMPPRQLRDTIVLTQKITPFSRWTRHRKPTYAILVAAAACIGILLTVGSLLHPGTDRDKDHASTFAALTNQVLDLKRHDLINLGEMSSDPAKLRAWLAERGAPSDFQVPLGLRGVPSLGCQSYVINGVKVSLVCFTLGPNQLIHLFIMDKDAVKDAPPDAKPSIRTDDSVAFVTWSVGDKSYVLTGNNVNEDILRRIINAA